MLTQINANEITKNLWQGSLPPPGSELTKLGFETLVLCAKEYQPASTRFTGVNVVYAPNNDDPRRPPTKEEMNVALRAAARVCLDIQKGKKVLVTCWQGLNRSGFVCALVLYMLKGMSGLQCRLQVQIRRPFALSNPMFVRVLDSLPVLKNQNTRNIK
jgi:protein-tyrosine phosphatase